MSGLHAVRIRIDPLYSHRGTQRHRCHRIEKMARAAKAVGENSHRDSRQCSQERGSRNEEGSLRRSQVSGVAEVGREGADQPPCREADRKMRCWRARPGGD
jgi:hypothetical protein